MTSEDWLYERNFVRRFNSGDSYWKRGRLTAYRYVGETLT